MTVLRYLLIGILFCSQSVNQSILANNSLRNQELPSYKITIDTAILIVAHRINNTYDEPAIRIKEIYRWVAANLSYDADQLINPVPYTNIEDLANQAVKNHKAICQGYTAVFDILCRQCELKSFIVHGYVKQNGQLLEIPHAWNAVLVNGKWQLFDPTWGSGYLDEDEIFVPRFTYDFFNISPLESVKARMPFDPIWQLIDRPRSHAAFMTGIETNVVNPINFNDSITGFLQSDSLSRYNSEIGRIEKSGLDNKMIMDYYEYLQLSREVLIQNRKISLNNQWVDISNQAIDLYNNAVSAYNKYIISKNGQFRKPPLSDEQIKDQIDKPDQYLERSEILMQSILTDDPELKNHLKKINQSISELRKAIDADKLFIDKYCRTPKASRLGLFRIPATKAKPRKK